MTDRGVYELRDPIALIAAGLIVATMAYAVNTLRIQQPEATPEPVTVRLVELPETPSPQPTPKPELPPPPQAEPQPPVSQPPVPQIEVAPPLPTPTPVVEAPHPMPKPVVETPTPAVEAPPPTPKPVVQPPQPVATPPAQHSNAATEGAYQAKARSQIAKNKHYPDEAMQMGMTGSTHVVYVIGRDGKLIRVDVEHSSGHTLLDQAALSAVRKTRFDPIPDDAWIHLKEQTFRTRIDFSID
jgi:protein TonB